MQMQSSHLRICPPWRGSYRHRRRQNKHRQHAERGPSHVCTDSFHFLRRQGTCAKLVSVDKSQTAAANKTYRGPETGPAGVALPKGTTKERTIGPCLSFANRTFCINTNKTARAHEERYGEDRKDLSETTQISPRSGGCRRLPIFFFFNFGKPSRASVSKPFMQTQCSHFSFRKTEQTVVYLCSSPRARINQGSAGGSAGSVWEAEGEI